MIACIVCGAVPEPAVPADIEQNQPYAATVFRAYGQYGSTVFDPMDRSFLEINVCDSCLVAHQDMVLHGKPSVVTHTDLKRWQP